MSFLFYNQIVIQTADLEKTLPQLTQNQATELLTKNGPNLVSPKKQVNPLILYFYQFKSPIILVLILSGILSIFFGEFLSGGIIFIMVLLSTILDFVQEFKSNKAVEKLSKNLARRATVIRDGVSSEISVQDVVVGDLVFLSTGDIVCGDGEVLFSDDLNINESSLTGESFGAEKILGLLVFAGTIVISGYGYIKVTATGVETKFGQISKDLNQPSSLNYFQKGINQFSFLILKATVVIVLTVLLINLLKAYLNGQFDRETLFNIALFSITIAVGLAPEMLPVIVSLNLGRGAQKMNNKGVLVKKLQAIQDFGSMDVLCTDKTGTLTEDEIELVQYLNLQGRSDYEILKLAYLNSIFQSGLKNPLDQAIINSHLKTNFTPEIDLSGDISFDSAQISRQTPLGFLKIDEIPYDFNRRRLSVVIENKEITTLITKGQPESVIQVCDKVLWQGREVLLNLQKSLVFQNLCNDLSSQGFRVIALARRVVKLEEHKFTPESEKNMVLLGVLAFLDPAKESAKSAIKNLENSGVNIKIITGDNELVTKKICTDLDLNNFKIITGDRVDKLSEIEFTRIVEENQIFARFNPEQKKRVIQALKNNGHVVGYLGDGINDVPSLKAADIGISVDNAVDVARESADLILLEKDLDILVQGVLEGRKTFGNTMKYVLMAISSNFGNMLSMIGAAIFLPFLPMLPLQILLNNLLYDASQLSLAGDRVDESYLEKPRKWDFTFIQRFMIVFGVLSTAFDFLTFYVLFVVFRLSPEAFQTGWFLQSITTQVLVILLIRTHKPFYKSIPSKYLLVNIGLIIALAWVLPMLIFGQSYFGFVSLSPVVLVTLLGISLCYLLAAEILKNRFYRKTS